MHPWIKNTQTIVYSLIIPLAFIGIVLYAGWIWVTTIDSDALVKQISLLSFQQWLIIIIIISISAILLWFAKRLSNGSVVGLAWKNALATIVIVGSFITLIILILFAFVDTFVDTNNDGILEFDRVFGAHSIQLIGLILPVLGTWVGTVLAFYFARENLQAAQDAFVGTGAQNRLLVTNFMLPIDSFAIFDSVDEKEETLTLTQIRDAIRGKPTARAVFLNNAGNVKYIFHDETIADFLAPKDQKTGSMSLRDFLDQEFCDNYPKYRDIGILFRSISRLGSILECKRMFDTAVKLQNIVVTETGDKDEKPLGLITRERLGEAALERSRGP